MRRVEIPVLIVGAGPVGLAAALLLARQGLASLVVDRRPGPHRAPQAHVVNPRTLEIFRQLGLDTGALRRRATPRSDGGQVVWVTTLAGTELGRLPYERQDDAVLELTPEPILNLPQHVLEPILLENVSDEPRIDVAWRHEWTTLAEEGGIVVSRICDLEGDEEYEVGSRWVLAADGAGSPVRTALGIGMNGPERLQSFVMIHFEADLRHLLRDRPAIIYWTVDPEAMGSFIAHDIDRTWVFMHPWDPDAEPADAYDDARCSAIVRRAIGRDDVTLAVRTVSRWHMTSQVAERYRAGRVFLVGDSAHRFPPAGGMGMNTGIQDAHNLAWKLGLVDAGRAGADVLATYGRERLPVARRNADQSLANAVQMLEMMAELGLGMDVSAAGAHLETLVASGDGRARIAAAIERQRDHFDMLGLQIGFAYEDGALVPDGTPAPTVANPVREVPRTARPGSRLPHAWIERAEVRCSSLDLIAPDAFTLLAGPAGAAWMTAGSARTVTPLSVMVAGRDFSAPDDWIETCGLARGGACLVRPDQHVAWRHPGVAGDPGAALAGALRALL